MLQIYPELGYNGGLYSGQAVESDIEYLISHAICRITIGLDGI